MSDDKAILKTALITDTTNGRQYNPGKMLKRLMERQGVSRKELHKKVKETYTSFASPCVISDFCNDYHVRHIPHTYLEVLIGCLGMPKQMARYYTCEFLKSLLDPTLHKYVDAPTRLVKPTVLVSLVAELRKEIVLKDEAIHELGLENTLLTTQVSKNPRWKGNLHLKHIRKKL